MNILNMVPEGTFLVLSSFDRDFHPDNIEWGPAVSPKKAAPPKVVAPEAVAPKVAIPKAAEPDAWRKKFVPGRLVAYKNSKREWQLARVICWKDSKYLTIQQLSPERVPFGEPIDRRITGSKSCREKWHFFARDVPRRRFS